MYSSKSLKHLYTHSAVYVFMLDQSQTAVCPDTGY